MGDVYPQPQTAPLSLGAGAASAFIPITEITGPDPDFFNLPTMFIRIVMLGAGGVDPTVALQAGTGAPVTITATTPPGNPINDGANPTEAGNAHITGPDADNVYLVKVIVHISSSWQIQITNNDGSPRNFTWVVGDSNSDAQESWIHVSNAADGTDALAYSALTNQDVPLTLLIENRGTGPLQGISPPALSAEFAASPPPVSIPPNGSGTITITFDAPAAPGEIAATTHTLTSNDPTVGAVGPAPGHNNQFTLEATTGQLEVMLVLDASGSMAYKPNGASVGAGEKARWDHLMDAVDDLFDLLGFFANGLGKFGVAIFPDITTGTVPAPVPSSADIKTATGISVAELANAFVALNTHEPVEHGGGTPIGHGIQRVMGGAYFNTDPTAIALNRRWLLLMSDGANNSVPPDPVIFHTGSPTPLAANEIDLFAVGYGDPDVTSFHVNHTLLQNLAAGSPEGQFYDVGANDADIAGLRSAFTKVLVDGLSLAPASDPSGVLTSHDPEVRRQIPITPFDTKVAFVVRWSTDDEERVSVQLMTPDCELITPETAEDDPHIGYRSHARSKIYTIDEDYLRNAGSEPGEPRYGMWTLIITGHGLDGGIIITGHDGGEQEHEPYEYQVITESRLQLQLSLDQPQYYAGDPIGLSARLTVDGKPIANAAVTLELTSPGQFFDNWLARSQVTAAEFAEAAQALANEDVIGLGIKAFALQQKGLRFNPAPKPKLIAMTEESHPGVYSTAIQQTSVPGTYTFYVTAEGETDDGVSFRREQQMQVRLEVRPVPEFTHFDIQYRTVIEDGQRFIVADINVRPQDQYGNVVLVDPAFDSSIALTADGGEFTGALVGNHDGSYVRSLRYEPGVKPAIRLQVGEEEIIPTQEVIPVVELYYADVVLDFQLGGEAEPGANQHADPQVALGDVTEKAGDEFVALGGFGSLTVGVEGKVVLAQYTDDVYVFVQLLDRPRAYRVEALPVGGTQNDWIELGTSSGITQSFSLRQAGLQAAEAIRITDRSGITRDGEAKPSSAPGVGIRGVGFRKIGEAEEPGIRVESVLLVDAGGNDQPLRNDTAVAAETLARGIRIVCDQEVDPDSVQNKPVCFVTLELPYPLSEAELDGWDVSQPVGYQLLRLGAQVAATGKTIEWQPTEQSAAWLQEKLGWVWEFLGKIGHERGNRLLAHLTLKGNFIWAQSDAARFLDGETFGAPAAGRTDVHLPSGDGRAGGDFEMWFWLVREVSETGFGIAVNQKTRILQPNVQQAVNMAIDRASLQHALPPGYEVDHTQPFDPAQAKEIIAKLGLTGRTLSLIAGQQFAQAVELLEGMLAEIGFELKATIVPDAEVLDTVRSALFRPVLDMVIVDDYLRRLLAAQFPNHFDGTTIRF